LTVSNLPAGWVSGVANGTYDVAQSDYHPLLVQTTVERGPGATYPETVQFSTYEYLPATPANMALLDLSAQHPSAAVVPLQGTDGGSNGGSNGKRCVGEWRRDDAGSHLAQLFSFFRVRFAPSLQLRLPRGSNVSVR